MGDGRSNDKKKKNMKLSIYVGSFSVGMMVIYSLLYMHTPNVPQYIALHSRSVIFMITANKCMSPSYILQLQWKICDMGTK